MLVKGGPGDHPINNTQPKIGTIFSIIRSRAGSRTIYVVKSFISHSISRGKVCWNLIHYFPALCLVSLVWFKETHLLSTITNYFQGLLSSNIIVVSRITGISILHVLFVVTRAKDFHQTSNQSRRPLEVQNLIFLSLKFQLIDSNIILEKLQNEKVCSDFDDAQLN